MEEILFFCSLEFLPFQSGIILVSSLIYASVIKNLYKILKNLSLNESYCCALSRIWSNNFQKISIRISISFYPLMIYTELLFGNSGNLMFLNLLDKAIWNAQKSSQVLLASRVRWPFMSISIRKEPSEIRQYFLLYFITLIQICFGSIVAINSASVILEGSCGFGSVSRSGGRNNSSPSSGAS